MTQLYFTDSRYVEMLRDIDSPVLAQTPPHLRNAMNREMRGPNEPGTSGFNPANMSSRASSVSGSRQTSPVRERTIQDWFRNIVPEHRPSLYIPKYLADQYSFDNLSYHVRPSELNPYRSAKGVHSVYNFQKFEFLHIIHNPNNYHVAHTFVAQFLEFSHAWSDWLLQ